MDDTQRIMELRQQLHEHNYKYYVLNQPEISDQESLAEAVKVLRGYGVNDFVVTLGSKGSLVFENGHSVHVPSLKVEAVDATAAGDTFCAAVCVGLSEGMSLVDAARFATKAAAITVQRIGAQDSIPTRSEVE